MINLAKTSTTQNEEGTGAPGQVRRELNLIRWMWGQIRNLTNLKTITPRDLRCQDNFILLRHLPSQRSSIISRGNCSDVFFFSLNQPDGTICDSFGNEQLIPGVQDAD